MCTVTYLPLSNNNFILTSSRDVPFARESALHPQTQIEEGVTITYPKDGKAGGTWIGVSSQKRLICLLNGGFEYHTSRTSYRKSRGIIVKDLLKVTDIDTSLENIDLNAIEQFTMVIVDWQNSLQLIEFVWDGVKKYITKLPQETHIWSSATLYDPSVKKLREEWFATWQKNNKPTQETILEFHHTAGIGDSNIDVVMNRGLGGTISITSVIKTAEKVSILYEDTLDKSTSTLEI